MKFKFRQTVDAAVLDVVQPGAEGQDDTVVNSITLNPGSEVELSIPSVTDATQVEVGEVKASPAAEAEGGTATDQPTSAEGEAGGAPAPTDAPADPAPPAPEGGEGGTDTPQLPEGLAIGRIVTYRSKTGAYDLPAIVTATIATLDPEGVDQGHVAQLTAPSRVHLTVFTCGIPGTAREGSEVNDQALGGSYQEFNIPQFAGEAGAEVVAGTWRFPERV